MRKPISHPLQGNPFFTLSSWFRLPHEGMKQYEILSRATAFLTPRISDSFPRNYHVIGAAHVCYPFEWRRFYPQEEWLEAVGRQNVKHKLEIRQRNTGHLIHSIDLSRNSVHSHRHRDLAVLHMDNENELLDIVPDPLSPPLADKSAIFSEEEPAILTGSEVINCGLHDEEVHYLEEEGFYSKSINPISIEKSQHFFKTKKVLPMGMCGGPALIPRPNQIQNYECAGIIEGVVNPPSETYASRLAALQGNLVGQVAVVGINTVRAYIESIEDSPPKELSEPQKSKQNEEEEGDTFGLWKWLRG